MDPRAGAVAMADDWLRAMKAAVGLGDPRVFDDYAADGPRRRAARGRGRTAAGRALRAPRAGSRRRLGALPHLDAAHLHRDLAPELGGNDQHPRDRPGGLAYGGNSALGGNIVDTLLPLAPSSIKDVHKNFAEGAGFEQLRATASGLTGQPEADPLAQALFARPFGAPAPGGGGGGPMRVE